MVGSDKVNLPEAQTTRYYDREFFLTYESFPRGVEYSILIIEKITSLRGDDSKYIDPFFFLIFSCAKLQTLKANGCKNINGSNLRHEALIHLDAAHNLDGIHMDIYIFYKVLHIYIFY